MDSRSIDPNVFLCSFSVCSKSQRLWNGFKNKTTTRKQMRWNNHQRFGGRGLSILIYLKPRYFTLRKEKLLGRKCGTEHMFRNVIYFNIFIERHTFIFVPPSPSIQRSNRFVKCEQRPEKNPKWYSPREICAKEIYIQMKRQEWHCETSSSGPLDSIAFCFCLSVK